MLTQLATVKDRLGIMPGDTQYDAMLTRAIEVVSARFDSECNRAFARTVGASQEFNASDTEIIARCYPIEVVSKFEFKAAEADGWTEQVPAYLLRRGCVISLTLPLGAGNSIARITYTGGYVLPGTAPAAGQSALPLDIENAAIEQVAFWFQRRETLGVIRIWPSGGNYIQLVDTDLLPAVRAVLRKHTRFTL